jgi:hypothetical protein
MIETAKSGVLSVKGLVMIVTITRSSAALAEFSLSKTAEAKSVSPSGDKNRKCKDNQQGNNNCQ